MSEQNRGRKMSAETHAKMAVIRANTVQIHTPEGRLARRARMLGRTLSPETIEKTRQANLGRKQSPEEIASRTASITGQKRTPEQRARISEAKKRLGHGIGIKQSPELIEKRAAALRGRKRPPELVAVMHGALRQRNQAIFESRLEAARPHMDLNITQLAAKLGCTHRTARHCRKELLCRQIAQQSAKPAAAPNSPPSQAPLFM